MLEPQADLALVCPHGTLGIVALTRTGMHFMHNEIWWQCPSSVLASIVEDATGKGVKVDHCGIDLYAAR